LEALHLLANAEKAMILVGTSVKWSNAQTELGRFLDKTDLPAFANGMGRGMIPRDSRHLFQRTRRRAMEECDVLILAGSILDFRLAFGTTIPKKTKIIQLEMDHTLVGHNRPSDIALVGNLSCTFDLLCQLMDEKGIQINLAAYAESLRAEETPVRKQPRESAGEHQGRIPAQVLCREIAGFVNDNMIVIGDGGDIVAQAAKVVPVPKNGFWMDPGPLGTLGVGMPFAIAAQAAHPDKRVLIIYGDGSFGLNGFEYDTAIRFGFPIVGIVGNDAAWGQMMRPQRAFYGDERMAATHLTYTRYDKVVEALGGYGEHVTRPDEIRPALERAFASGKASCINVEIERDLDFKGGIYM
jgi:acetolactate synthase-1/2/3 large subunit